MNVYSKGNVTILEILSVRDGKCTATQIHPSAPLGLQQGAGFCHGGGGAGPLGEGPDGSWGPALVLLVPCTLLQIDEVSTSISFRITELLRSQEKPTRQFGVCYTFTAVRPARHRSCRSRFQTGSAPASKDSDKA